MTSKKFPGMEVESAPSAGESQPGSKSQAGRIAVTIAVLMLVIGGVAWVVQYLPGKSPRPQPKPLDGKRIDLLRFTGEAMGHVKAVWDPRDEEYYFEVERDNRGSHDFYFENVHPGAVRLGLESTSCDCSEVKAAVLTSADLKARWDELEARRRQGDRDAVFSEKDLSWVVLDKIKGMAIPENGKGLVRVGWHARKTEGSKLRLNVKIWANPDDNSAQRVWTDLETKTVVVPKLLFDNGKVAIGPFSGGLASGQAVAFTATRNKLDLKVADDGPLFAWKMTPLDRPAVQRLEAAMRKNGINTRIRAAVSLRLTIAEEKNGQVIDQGPFERRPTLTLEGESVQDGVPVFHGRVQGDIKIGGLDDYGKIQLNSFPVKQGVRKQLFLWTDRKTALAVDRRNPPFLDVKLKVVEDAREKSDKEKKWELEVIVPTGSPPGAFTDDSAVLLRTDTTPPRRIRIPIRGTAVPG